MVPMLWRERQDKVGGPVSHLTTVRTQWSDPNAMAAALEQLGFKVVQSAGNSMRILDYYGYDSDVTVCLRATAPGLLSGKSELGFVKQADGTLSIVVDNMDMHRPWYKQLPQRYSYARAMAELRRKGYSVVDEKTADGHIYVKVQKYAN